MYVYRYGYDIGRKDGGGVAEEYYHGFGFNADEIVKKYLDKRLADILFHRKLRSL